MHIFPQDLFNKFQSLVLPEAVNYILSEEDSMIEMLRTVSGFTLSMFPDMGIQEALSLLAEGLRDCSLKVGGVGVCVGGGGRG